MSTVTPIPPGVIVGTDLVYLRQHGRSEIELRVQAWTQNGPKHWVWCIVTLTHRVDQTASVTVENHNVGWCVPNAIPGNLFDRSHLTQRELSRYIRAALPKIRLLFAKQRL